MSDLKQLEPRFQQPEGWQCRYLPRDGYTLRYGFLESGRANAKTIVVLPGLSEFCEKYFELTHDMVAQGHNVLIVDWRGQGLSSRYFADAPHKRHSQGFDNDARDLQAVIADSPFDPQDTDFVMMAHSMGGNIGLRFLDMFSDTFNAAAFSAPLIGLHALEHWSDTLSWMLTHGFKQFAGESYAFGGGDWEPYSRDMNSHVFFSCDTARSAVHNVWMKHNPDLQVGHVTNRWISDAQDSCVYIRHKLDVGLLSLPTLFSVAGHDQLVDNGAIRDFSRRLPHSQLIEFPQARHEIWMEREEIRQNFLDNFIHLLDNLH